jgi:hypothetical protein
MAMFLSLAHTHTHTFVKVSVATPEDLKNTSCPLTACGSIEIFNVKYFLGAKKQTIA